MPSPERPKASVGGQCTCKRSTTSTCSRAADAAGDSLSASYVYRSGHGAWRRDVGARLSCTYTRSMLPAARSCSTSPIVFSDHPRSACRVAAVHSPCQQVPPASRYACSAAARRGVDPTTSSSRRTAGSRADGETTGGLARVRFSDIVLACLYLQRVVGGVGGASNSRRAAAAAHGAAELRVASVIGGGGRARLWSRRTKAPWGAALRGSSNSLIV